MKDLGMPLSETGLDLPMVLQQLKTARTALFHGGRKTQPLSKDQGIAGFETGNKFQSAARTERPAQRSKMEEQEQE